MAQYNNIKNFCNRVIHLEKTGSKEIRLTQSEAVVLMSELNQLLLEQLKPAQTQRTSVQPTSVSVDAGTF
tara:strand:+ start:1523 stop:1732 length:210 start_codon:yes stop_codon:yes gene_type:complete